VVTCERCGDPHDGEFGSGRFCSLRCSKARTFSARSKSQMAETYSKNNPLAEYLCEKCGKAFYALAFRKGKLVRCTNCRRKVPVHQPKASSIKELSKRTAVKIIKRSNLGCAICGWNDAACDIHHIIPRSAHGSDDHSNLVILCPNHHRVLHSPNDYSLEFLCSVSLNSVLPEWQALYYADNTRKV